MTKIRREKMTKNCTCTLREKLAGDGCRWCNPELARDMAETRVAELEQLLRNVMAYAHKHSTGPAKPDKLWDIRTMIADEL